MPLDIVDFRDRARIARLSDDEQRSVALLDEVATYLKEQPYNKVMPHQKQAMDGLARDLNIFLEIFVKTRERLCSLELPEEKLVPSNSQESIELPTIKKEFDHPPAHPPPAVPLPHTSSSSNFSLLDVVKAEWFPIFPLQEARTMATIAKENTSRESLINKSINLSSSSSSTVSSVLEITRQDSNGEYHRVDHGCSKNASSLGLFDKAKAMLNNTSKKQHSGHLVKEPGNDKKQAKTTMGQSSRDRHILRRVRRKISRGDKVGLAQ